MCLYWNELCKNIIKSFFRNISEKIQWSELYSAQCVLQVSQDCLLWRTARITHVWVTTHYWHALCNFSQVLRAAVKKSFWSSILQFQPHLLISSVFYSYILATLSALPCRSLYTFLHSNPVELLTFYCGNCGS